MRKPGMSDSDGGPVHDAPGPSSTDDAGKLRYRGGRTRVMWVSRTRGRDGGAPGDSGQDPVDRPRRTARAARRLAGVRRSVSGPASAVDLLAILGASQAISSQTDPAHLCTQIRGVLGSVAGAGTVTIAVRGDGPEAWDLFATSAGREIAVGLAEATERALLPVSALRYVRRTGEPLVIADATRDERFHDDPYFRDVERCSLMAVPIFSHGEVQAVVLLDNRLSRRGFRADRLDAVLLLAGQVAVSLDNARRYASLEATVAARTEELAAANQHLELLSITDALTGLPNQRRLTEWLDAEWLRAMRSSRPVAVAVVDVDHFTQYNDHYGHPMGDDCLRRIAGALRTSVRATDLVARSGGEEFTLVLPETDRAMASLVAERARAMVAALGEEHAASPAGRITVSIGVAVDVPTAFSTADQLIKLAGAHLDDAKRRGRDTVAG
jgi:diguanylate cyclase (GGDEF)-like protein